MEMNDPLALDCREFSGLDRSKPGAPGTEIGEVVAARP
jgi:hypothetical protein